MRDAAAPRAVDVLGGATMGTTWSVKLVAPRARDLHALHARHPGATGRRGRADEQLGSRLRPQPLQRRRRRQLACAARRLLDGAVVRARHRPRQRWRLRPDASARWSMPGASVRPGANACAARSAVGTCSTRMRLATRRSSTPHSAASCKPGGTRLDLCAIAKGFGVDAVAAQLRAQGIDSALVEVGGELFGYGRKPDGTPWRVIVEAWPGDEDDDSEARVLALDGLRRRDLRRPLAPLRARRPALQPHHRPAQRPPGARDAPAAVTVAAADAMHADGWATALTVMGVRSRLRRSPASTAWRHVSSTQVARRSQRAHDARLRRAAAGMSTPSLVTRAWLGNALVLLVLLVVVARVRPVAGRCMVDCVAAPGPLAAGRAGAARLPGPVRRVVMPASRPKARSALRRDNDATGDDAVLLAWASQTGFAQQLAEHTAQALRGAGVAVRALPLGPHRCATCCARIGARCSSSAPPAKAIRPTTCWVSPATCSIARSRCTGLRVRGARAGRSRLRAVLRLRPSPRPLAAPPRRAAAVRPHRCRRRRRRRAAALAAPTRPARRHAPTARLERAGLSAVATARARAGSIPAVSAARRTTSRWNRRTQRDLDWQAGDIAEIGPRHAHAEVAALAIGERSRWCRGGQDAAMRASRCRRCSRVRACRSRRDVRGQGRAVGGRRAAAIAASRVLDRLAARATAACTCWCGRCAIRDGRLGSGSGWLTAHAAPGERIDLRIRRNPSFHATGRRSSDDADRQRHRPGRPARAAEGAHRRRPSPQLAAVRRAQCRARFPLSATKSRPGCATDA